MKKEKPTLPVHQIVYCSTSERWHAYNEDIYCCPIHCGDGFCIRIKDRYFSVRIELDKEWYILIDEDKFRLHPKQKYDVILLF